MGNEKTKGRNSMWSVYTDHKSALCTFFILQTIKDMFMHDWLYNIVI